MQNFDAPTLVVVDAYVLALLSVLLLVSAFQGQRERALLFTALGCLLGALGLAVSLLRMQPELHTFAVTASNAMLILGHATVWAAFRAFSRDSQQPGWLVAGSLAWVALCQLPQFQESIAMRIAVYSLMCNAYLGLALWEVWGLHRRRMFGVLPAVVVLSLQMLFNVYRLFAERMPPIQGADQSGFALTMFQSILFAVSLSFIVLMMVRERAERQYRHAALHDDLTNLHNRRAFFVLAPRVLETARAQQRDAALLMCDLDWFKRINDEYGHVAGDRALALVGEVLRASVRSDDVCARIGGEEFVVLAYGADLVQGMELAERIRERLVESSVETKGLLSISIGIVTATQAGHDLDRLLVRADEALYRAKSAGRDRAVTWAPPVLTGTVARTA